MSEVLQKKELAARPRGIGAVACAACPFAELGCAKQGNGDCPPPEAIKAKQATMLLENDDVNAVIATDGGYEGLLQKPKENLTNILSMPPIVSAPNSIQKPLDKPIPKIEKPKQVLAPKRRGQSVGEFVAALLLPTQKAA